MPGGTFIDTGEEEVDKTGKVPVCLGLNSNREAGKKTRLDPLEFLMGLSPTNWEALWGDGRGVLACCTCSVGTGIRWGGRPYPRAGSPVEVSELNLEKGMLGRESKCVGPEEGMNLA